MAGFSTKERMIAAMLSSMPGIKKYIKNIYIRLNALIYRKPYKFIVDSSFGNIHLINPSDSTAETFFGYYDKSCEQNGKLLFHRTIGQPTSKKPDVSKAVEIVVRDLSSQEDIVIGETYSYNWQQGARAQWIDNDRIIFNTMHNNTYCAAMYELSSGNTTILSHPIQESLKDGRYLSINYARIMKLRPDYGYRNLPLPNKKEMTNLRSDGIKIININSGEAELLHSLSDIVSTKPRQIFERCYHVVNHIMSNPNGDGFIFIHRFYEGKRRHDRLIYSNFKTLKILVDDDMVSHCCWLDNNTVLGYLRYEGTNGFFTIDINTGFIREHDLLNSINMGDGHPSVSGNYIAVDTYPDKSRIQHLFLLNRNEESIKEIVEVYHSVKYMDESRCDMHPRFSVDGKRLYFDTVYTGVRRLAYIDLI